GGCASLQPYPITPQRTSIYLRFPSPSNTSSIHGPCTPGDTQPPVASITLHHFFSSVVCDILDAHPAPVVRVYGLPGVVQVHIGSVRRTPGRHLCPGVCHQHGVGGFPDHSYRPHAIRERDVPVECSAVRRKQRALVRKAAFPLPIDWIAIGVELVRHILIDPYDIAATSRPFDTALKEVGLHTLPAARSGRLGLLPVPIAPVAASRGCWQRRLRTLHNGLCLDSEQTRFFLYRLGVEMWHGGWLLWTIREHLLWSD